MDFRRILVIIQWPFNRQSSKHISMTYKSMVNYVKKIKHKETRNRGRWMIYTHIVLYVKFTYHQTLKFCVGNNVHVYYIAYANGGEGGGIL